MFQSSYTGIKPLHRNTAYNGGFCQFWFIPIEDIAVFPRINAATQYLVDEPLLKAGAAWFGPIGIPRDRFGFTEEIKIVGAGHYYAQKVEGMHPGESADSRINYENLPYHRFLVAGKLRAGGFYTLVGTVNSPLRFSPEYRSGSGPADTAQNLFSFTTNHRSKAYILPKFSADAIAPVNGGNGSNANGGITMNNKETIFFTNQPTIHIPWTPLRQSRFGNFPFIQGYMEEDDGTYSKIDGGNITADAPPPLFTELTVRLGGNPSGFIEIM